MAEKWKISDSARTMSRKFNDLVTEVNDSKKVLEAQSSQNPTEKTGLAIEGLTISAVENLIQSQKTSTGEA